MGLSIAEIKSQFSIDDAIRFVSPGLQIKRQGDRGSAHCPFHPDSSPSLSLDFKNNRFNCFGCGAKGDALDYVQMSTGKSLNDVLTLLSQELGIYGGHDDERFRDVQKQIDEQKRSREIIKEFSGNVASTYDRLCLVSRAAGMIIDSIRCPEDLDRPEVAAAINVRSYADYLLDTIIAGGAGGKIFAIRTSLGWCCE